MIHHDIIYDGLGKLICIVQNECTLKHSLGDDIKELQKKRGKLDFSQMKNAYTPTYLHVCTYTI